MINHISHYGFIENVRESSLKTITPHSHYFTVAVLRIRTEGVSNTIYRIKNNVSCCYDKNLIFPLKLADKPEVYMKDNNINKVLMWFTLYVLIGHVLCNY